MKRLIGVCIIGLLLLVGAPKSDAIIKIVGGQAACDTAFTGCFSVPLTVTNLCVSAVSLCPIRASASFTSSTRFWGTINSIAGCSTSTNSGVTWGACTAQPFSSGAKEHYAGAADGSVIAVAQVAGNCVVKRSVNNATSWSTVFTYVTSAGCGGANTGGTLLKCLSNGTCEMPFVNTGTQFCHVLESTDNGQNWSSITAFSGCIDIPAGSAYNGTNGIVSSQVTGGTSTILNTVSGFGGWTKSAAWGVGAGDCWGSVIYNGTAHSICFSVTNYTMNSPAGVLELNMIIPGVSAVADTGGLAFSVGTNNLYVLAGISGTSRSGLWITQNGSTFILLATNPLNTGVREGDTFFANGCIYFAANSIFQKIC
jgi:hypothetical protein